MWQKIREAIVEHVRLTVLACTALLIAGSLGVLAQTGQMNLLNPIITGHFINGGSGAATLQPTTTGCTLTAGSTDTDGGCAATAASGTVVFAQAYATAPICSVVDASATSTVSMPVYTPSTTGITLTTIINAHQLYWHCASKAGG